MRALAVLAAAVLALFLIGQVRVGGRAEFNAEGFFLWIRLGRLQIKLLPGKPKEDKPPKKRRKPKEPKKPKKPKKERPPTPWPEKAGGALEYAQALRVDVLELELTAGGGDPADTAMLYGQANAALGALWLPLTKAFHVKDGTARVKLDFDAPGMTLYGGAALSIKIGTVVWVGLRAGWQALFGALAAKKRLKLKRQQRKAA